jgi:hypothetical protein
MQDQHTPEQEQHRDPQEHRQRVVATLRAIAQWRKEKGYEYDDDRYAKKRSLRAKAALRRLANFVEALPVEDHDLYNLLHVPPTEDGQLQLSADAFALLSRFGMAKGFNGHDAQASEAQMRNVLRRANGVEQAKRHEARVRAQQGYGDE